ncbi:MAG: hypothetical protein ACLUNO_03275 [Oscillospiraceae bacterium]
MKRAAKIYTALIFVFLFAPIVDPAGVLVQRAQRACRSSPASH